jgi:hypothetical protein
MKAPIRVFFRPAHADTSAAFSMAFNRGSSIELSTGAFSMNEIGDRELNPKGDRKHGFGESEKFDSGPRRGAGFSAT